MQQSGEVRHHHILDYVFSAESLFIIFWVPSFEYKQNSLPTESFDAEITNSSKFSIQSLHFTTGS